MKYKVLYIIDEDGADGIRRNMHKNPNKNIVYIEQRKAVILFCCRNLGVGGIWVIASISIACMSISSIYEIF